MSNLVYMACGMHAPRMHGDGMSRTMMAIPLVFAFLVLLMPSPCVREAPIPQAM